MVSVIWVTLHFVELVRPCSHGESYMGDLPLCGVSQALLSW